MIVAVHTRPEIKTMLVKLNDVFPECSILLSNYKNLFNLNCFSNNFCPAQSGCMEKLAPRIRYLFDQFPEVGMILTYFRSQNDQKLRSGVFYRDNVQPPRVIKLGPKGWERLKNYVELFEVRIPSELMNLVGTGGPNDIVSSIGIPRKETEDE